MSTFVVACPGCGTQFRVTPAHLAPARGLVRCGACLTVFRAEEMRVDGAPTGTGAGVAAADGVADPTTDQVREQPSGHARRHRSVLARRQEAEPQWEPRAEAQSEPEPEPEPELELELEPEPTTQPVPAWASESARSLREDDLALAELPEDDLRAPPRLEEITLPAEAERVAAALEEQRRALARRPGKRWTAGAVLLALLLAVELVWLNFDALAEAPATRPLASALCGFLGCELATRRDIEAIRSRRLVVRSHPERTNGLRVDAVIVNRAPWPQAFPDVELRFSDIGGRLVAARRFAPGEYLAGEVAGRREMPVAAPVQISIDLLDPGPGAVNYEMRLYRQRGEAQ